MGAIMADGTDDSPAMAIAARSPYLGTDGCA